MAATHRLTDDELERKLASLDEANANNNYLDFPLTSTDGSDFYAPRKPWPDEIPQSADSDEDWQIVHGDGDSAEQEDEDEEEREDDQLIFGRRESHIDTSPQLDKEIMSNEQYFEYDPTRALRQDPSRTTRWLIYICTAIYSLVPLASLLSFIALFGLLFTSYYYITLAYYAYALLTRGTCNSGGRRWNIVYNSSFWSYLAAYFPIKLRQHKDLRLDPNENYLLCYHPHGISALGAVASLATNGLQLTKIFPNITARFLVHETSFLVPLMRETFLLRGDCSVNGKSIDHLLGPRASTGNLLAIVTGGLAEADLSDPEVLKVVVAHRKGFVKKALTHGAHLIPCIGLGENSVFKKVNYKPGSFMHNLEAKFYERFKFKHPAYYGRSIVSESLPGCVPLKRPITVCLGKPITVARIDAPTQVDIDSLHAQYLEGLRDLYEANKDLCTEFDREMLVV